ncbi:hypothetical protein BDM02DRAFT_3113263 [Thelephora ganbajun]|uniref:Uncharacterized protein n=1 Tax=Thelephora ganbajun TaxID=370292 RepID=A0ACB6ZIZ8_THEGA|nr:hypothetical protein BDM02DRAFT_3113263 [Thelephora ganbajun]
MVSGLWVRNLSARFPERCIGVLDSWDVTTSRAFLLNNSEGRIVPKTHVMYVALDPGLPPAWHTEQNVYIAQESPVTFGEHGTAHSPVFSNDRTKVAWAELAGDGCESDRAVLVVYDLRKDESYKLTSCWDRSPASISFSEDDKYLHFTAGSKARVKVFVLPVPASNPSSDKKLASPFKPTDEHTTSTIQPLPSGRLLYFQNSFTKPNDVHLTRGLNQLPASYNP